MTAASDFDERIAFLLAESRARLARGISTQRAQFAARGSLASSSAVKGLTAEAQKHLEHTLLELFANTKTAERLGVPAHERAVILDRAVCAVIDDLRATCRPASYSTEQLRYLPTEQSMDELEERGRSLLRQFHAGYLTQDVEGGTRLSITMGDNASGIVIQQGSHHSDQYTKLSVNLAEARRAADALAKAVSDVDWPAASAVNLTAEIETLQAQLRKETPSTPILKEVGRSIRSIVEQIAAGAATPAVTTALAALLAALGLG